MIDLNTQKTNTLSSQIRPQQPLYESGQLQHKSVSALRASFNHWIRSLPMEQRFLALKIHSAPLPHTIRRFFNKIDQFTPERSIQMEPSKYEYSKDEIPIDLKKTTRKLQKTFYDSLVFVTDGHDYLDHICFQFGLLQCPQKLFDFLVTTLDGGCCKPMLQALKNQSSSQKINERILKVKTKEQAIIQILNYLRQQVFLRFRQVMLDSQFISRNLEHEKRRKKDFNLFWKHLSHQSRYNLLLLNYPNITELYKELIISDIFITQQELKMEIEELLKLQKNDFCNRIFKCKFKKSDSAIIDYYQLVYQLWKKEMQKSKKKKGQKYNPTQKDNKNIKQDKQYHKKSKNLQHRKSNSLESNETNVTDNEKIYERQEKSRLKIEIHLEKEEQFKNDQIEQIEEKEIYRKPPKEQKIKNKHRNKNKHELRQKQKQKQQRIIPKVQQQQFDLECVNPQKKKESRLIQKTIQKINPFSYQQLKQAQLFRLSQQLQDMSDKTSEQANKYHDRRVIAFERIQYLLAFYNISIRLFGSCASGIAIKNSDIDIAVDNSILLLYDYLPQNLKLLGALQSLEQIFASQPCFTYIKLIKTASIPVIKLTIDTSIQFLNPYYGQVYQNLNRHHFSGPIQSDITIQTVNKLSQCNHLGLISTEAINSWLSQISSLHTIVIFMKQTLKNHRFNITYQGGLNTFAMIVLLVSYIRYVKLEEETNTAKVLQEILKFYAFEFNQKQYGIDLLQYKQNKVFYKKRISKNENNKDTADLQILDPKCEGKNMTRNCYQFIEIKKLFKQILCKCFTDPLKEVEKWSGSLLDKGMILEKMKKMDENRNVFTQFLTS